MQRICFLGDVCKDVNTFSFRNDGVEDRCAGGGVYYGAVCAKNMGCPVVVYTRYAEQDDAFFRSHMPGVDMIALPSPSTATSCCHNDYPSVKERVSFFESLAAPITECDVKSMKNDLDLSNSVVHVNPLWYGMVPASVLPSLDGVGFLGCDMQGFCRHIVKTGEDAIKSSSSSPSMLHKDWADKAQYLPYFNFVKLDSQEGEILTGMKEDRVSDVMNTIHTMMNVGQARQRVVLYTCTDGVYVYDGHDVEHATWGAWKIEGRTGRGDTCTTAFLYAYKILGQSLQNSVKFAAEITTKKMQYKGPYQGY